MLIYFGTKGQVKEYLEYDSVPRTGTTAFKIFAIFEGLDVSTVRKVYMKLYTPGLTYFTFDFDLEMEYDDNFIFDGESAYLKKGQKYDAFVLDFSRVLRDDGDPSSSFISAPGLWKVVITVYGNNYNVQGLATMNVQSGIMG